MLVFPCHGIMLEELEEPERKRAIDDIPINVEELITGHYFIHDGRHRTLRAIARRDIEMVAYVLLH